MLDEIFTRPPLPPEGEGPVSGISRLWSEGDVLYGPVLLFGHFVIAALGWILEQYWSVPQAVTPWELGLSIGIALTMMIPVFLILRSYYHQKVSPLPTIFYMFGHAGLIIVGYAGIYGMLGYGPAGGFDPNALATAGDCIPTWERNFYLSAITFTTVGYGDCAPYGVARFFAGIQGVLSVVFVGTTVGLMTGIAPTGDDAR
ncbi:MAG: ion channel [Pseudomonadota bacterium]